MTLVLDGIEFPGVQNISTDENRAVVEHQIPGMDGSLFQNLGRNPTTISFSGIFRVSQSDKKETVEELRANALKKLEELRKKFHAGEPVSFVADITTETKVSKALICDLRVEDVAGRPEQFSYSIALREYVEFGLEDMEALAEQQIADAQLLEAEEFLSAIEDSLSNIAEFMPSIEKLVVILNELRALLPRIQKQGLDFFFPPSEQ